MIIRSQNKKSIVNLDNTFEIGAHDKKVVVSGSYSAVGLLGIYSTEEKAIKVLDMICHFADKVHLEKLQSNPIRTDGTVFQMPLDEDVEV